MRKVFFNDWELWQKMTFVLGVCIFIVFSIAYGKLICMNRLVRKQEAIDEEKRTRIRELRQSGQIIETSKAHDIPFGVRAIQSGVQVDGIWISNTSTPVTSELKLGHQSGSFSDSPTDVELSKYPKVTMEASSASPKLARPTSKQGRSLFGQGDLGSSFLEHTDDTQKPASTNNRKSYQPRKSSHLRYDSYGAYDEATLGRLEGNPLPKKKVQAHRPRRSGQIYSEAESSAADNERNSGTSSDSDATFSEAKVPAGQSSVRPTQMLLNSNTDYFPIPTESPAHDVSVPFTNPMEASLSSRRPSAQAIRVSSWFGDSQEIPQQHRSHSPFVSGELHLNKSMRKVNSGFEVLPAGTFGAPVDYKGKGVDQGERWDDDGCEKRQANRLQKKRRNLTALDHLPHAPE